MEENKDFNELRRKYDEASFLADHLQIIGQKLSIVSEQGKKVLNHIEISKAFNDSMVKSWLAAANATIPSPPPEALTPLNSYYYAVSTTSSSSSVVFSLPIQNQQKEYELSETELNELDEYLREFTKEFPGGADLENLRKGAWQTFYSATVVNLMNASHGMREILRYIISQIATNEKVKESEWWEKPSETDKEVIGTQRFRYLIFGTKNDKPTELVNITIQECFKAFTRLQQVAHGSKEFREEVKKSMQITENTILTILRYRRLQKK